jgi:hypothetical protein
MTVRSLAAAVTLTSVSIMLSAQAPPAIDTAKIGPQVGQLVPTIDGVDQFGKRQSLSSTAGRRGTMLVFFRSADW